MIALFASFCRPFCSTSNKVLVSINLTTPSSNTTVSTQVDAEAAQQAAQQLQDKLLGNSDPNSVPVDANGQPISEGSNGQFTAGRRLLEEVNSWGRHLRECKQTLTLSPYRCISSHGNNP